MAIAEVSLVPCVQRLADSSWKFVRGPVAALHGWTLRLVDDGGHVGLGYGHALPTVSATGEGVKAGLDHLTPGLIGRDPYAVAEIMQEMEGALAGQPSVKAAIDMALHDLAARRLGVSLDVLLGGRKRASIPQGRIVPLKSPTEMANAAVALKNDGYSMIKLKWSGDPELDVSRAASVRKAVGPQTTLVVDANQSYSAKDFIRTFSKVEKFDIALVEQPVQASDWAGLALVTRTIPASVEADESAGSLDDVFALVRDRVVDSVNLKITKLGGIRNALAAATICEAGGVCCRLGAAFGPSLLQAFSAHVAATFRRIEVPCELSEHLHLRNDPFTALPVVAGSVSLPTGTGCGIDLMSSDRNDQGAAADIAAVAPKAAGARKGGRSRPQSMM